MQNAILQRGSAKFLRALNNQKDVEKWFEGCQLPAFAMVGRSNVGKSSLINKLLGAKTAKTSKTPGRTQAINVFEVEYLHNEELHKAILYDLPGYGFAKVSKAMIKSWQELINQFFISLNEKILVCNIQDARHPYQKSDQEFYDYIDPKSINIFLIFNKVDKLKKQKERAALNKVKKEIMKEFKGVMQIHYVSADSGEKCEELEYAIGSFLIQRSAIA